MLCAHIGTHPSPSAAHLALARTKDSRVTMRMLDQVRRAVFVCVFVVGCASTDESTPARHTTTPAGDDGGAPPDASASPPPPPPADAGDPCAGRRVCDSFESDAVGMPPGAPFSGTPNAGTVVVSDARAHSGAHSVKVSTSSAPYQSALFTTKGAPLFPLPSNELYGRMYVWLENPAADGVHWTMLNASGAVPGHTGVTAYVRYGGQLAGKLMANYDTTGASTDCWQHSATVMPIGKWVCFAWRFHGQTNEMELWMDGAELTDLHVSGSGQGCIGNGLGGQWLAPTFATASLGWESYQMDAGHTMYVDDVVLDAASVGCP